MKASGEKSQFDEERAFALKELRAVKAEAVAELHRTLDRVSHFLFELLFSHRDRAAMKSLKYRLKKHEVTITVSSSGDCESFRVQTAVCMTDV